MESDYRIRLFRVSWKLRKYVTLLGSMSHILKRVRRGKMSKKEMLKYIQNRYNLQKIYFGCYAEAYGKYAGILKKINGRYIVISGVSNYILHPTDNIVYFNNSIDKNIIYDFREGNKRR